MFFCFSRSLQSNLNGRRFCCHQLKSVLWCVVNSNLTEICHIFSICFCCLILSISQMVWIVIVGSMIKVISFQFGRCPSLVPCFRCQEFNWKTYSLAQSDRTIRQTQFEQCTSGDLCRILYFCQTSTNSRHILCRSVSFQIERPTSSNEDTPPPNTFNTLVGVEIGEQVRKTPHIW